MGSQKADKPYKNPKKKPRPKPLGPSRAKTKPKSKSKHEKKNVAGLIESQSNNENSQEVQAAPAVPAAAQQLSFFLHQFQSANGVQLSSLELESIKDSCIVELSQDIDQDVENLGNHMKVAFGPSWKESLCEKRLLEGKIDPGSPALLIISASALRSIELLRGFRSLTRDCHPVKLFSKHMKVEEQGNKERNPVDRLCRTYRFRVSLMIMGSNPNLDLSDGQHLPYT